MLVLLTVFIEDRLQAAMLSAGGVYPGALQAWVPRIEIKIDSTDSFLGGLIRLEGAMADMKAKGSLSVFDEKLDFGGRVSFSSEKVILKDFDLWSIGLVISHGEVDFKRQSVEAKAKLKHAYFKGLDVAGDITLSARYRFVKDAGRGRLCLEGALSTERLIINQRPFDDANMVFEIRDNTLWIQRFCLGRNILLSGSAGLKDPGHPLDLAITINNLNITQLLSSLRVQDITILSGLLNANITLRGACAKPSMKCRLDIKKGNLGNIFFKSMSASLNGSGTMIKIEDSRINTANGHLTMAGDLDLRNIGRRNLFSEVQVLTDDNNVFLEGWDITKRGRYHSKVEAVKNVSDRLDVGFRTFVENEDVNPDPRDRSSELELEYKMFEKETLKMKLSDEGEFLGVEHREEF